MHDTERSSLLFRGDFPAFYAAAQIARSGLGDQLYDLGLQRQIENEHWPSLAGRYYAFAYTPYLAFLLMPLAFFSPRSALAVHSLFMLMALGLTVLLLRGICPSVRERPLGAFAFFLSFPPVLCGVFAGQNIALSMLLLTAAISSLQNPRKRSELLAGIFLGCWLLKPHFALIALLFAIVAGRYLVVAGALIPAVCYYFLGAIVSGWSWPLVWFRAVNVFAYKDYIANQHQMVSLLGISKGLRVMFDIGPNEDSILAFIGVVLTAGTVALVAKLFLRLRRGGAGSPPREARNMAFAEALVVLAPTVLLVSPHTLFYELGLCLIPFARFADFRNDRSITLAVLCYVAVLFAVLGRPYFAVTPLAAVPLVCLAFCWFVLSYAGGGKGALQAPVLARGHGAW